MDLAGPLGKQSVSRHGEKDARLAKKHDHHRATQSADGAELHQEASPQRTPVMSMPIAIGSGTFSVVYFTRPVRTAGDEDVKNRADDQRTQNADGHVALRILGFLRRGGDRVEADVCEEDHSRRA